MAQTSLQLGAVLDIATGGEVKANGDRVVSSVADMFNNHRRLPTYVRKAAVGKFSNDSGDLILVLGTPPPGKLWHLQHLNVVQLTNGTTYDSVPAVPFFAGTAPNQISPTAIDSPPNMAGFIGEPAVEGIHFSVPYPVFSGDTLYAWVQVAMAETAQYTAVMVAAEIDVAQGVRGVL